MPTSIPVPPTPPTPSITPHTGAVDPALDHSSMSDKVTAMWPSNVSRQTTSLTLVSHHLCPYVQRAAIALQEKGVPYERRWVDLANKPTWFTAVSPLGKVPLLLVAQDEGVASAIFESAVILEYLEETQTNPLHPTDPLARASERAWMAFGSVVLDAIAALYDAPDSTALDVRHERLVVLLARLESELSTREPAWVGPYFRGSAFGLVDAVFGPVFRYFDVFEKVADLHLAKECEFVMRWREVLAHRASLRNAIDADYAERLEAFLAGKCSALGERVRERRGFGQGGLLQDQEVEFVEANAVIQWAQ